MNFTYGTTLVSEFSGGRDRVPASYTPRHASKSPGNALRSSSTIDLGSSSRCKSSHAHFYAPFTAMTMTRNAVTSGPRIRRSPHDKSLFAKGTAYPKTGPRSERTLTPTSPPSSRPRSSHFDSKITVDRRRTKVRPSETPPAGKSLHRQSSFFVRNRDSAIHILTD